MATPRSNRTKRLLVAFSAPTNATIGGFYGLGVGMITDDDVGAVTTNWTYAELSRLVQSAAYLNQTPEAAAEDRRTGARLPVGDLAAPSRTGPDRAPTAIDRSDRLHHHLDRVGCRDPSRHRSPVLTHRRTDTEVRRASPQFPARGRRSLAGPRSSSRIAGIGVSPMRGHAAAGFQSTRPEVAAQEAIPTNKFPSPPLNGGTVPAR